MSKFKTFRTVVLIILSLFVSLNIFAQTETISFDDAKGKNGLNILQQTAKNLELEFNVNRYFVEKKKLKGLSMDKITIDGVLLPGNTGAPDLPVYSRYVAIPQGAKVKLKVKVLKKEKVTSKEIMPAPRIPKEDEDGALFYAKDNKIYSNNAFYPEKSVIVSKPMKIRGVDVVLVSISPFQYNPVTKVLKINRDIKIELDFEGGNGHFGDDKYRSRYWDPIIKDNILNSAQLPEIDYSKRNLRSETGYEYIIITPDDPGFLAWADSIRMFRIKQGITTTVVTTSEIGGNTTTAMEHYVDSVYTNSDVPPSAILLLGDYGFTGNTIISPVYDDYCISDNLYADVDHDNLPDIVFARITAQNETQLAHMVTKFINYERNPPTNAGFYDHPVTAMGWQTERWFQLCSETIAGFFENSLGKHPVRENAIYQGNPSAGVWSTASNTNVILNTFGENGLGYIPNSPTYLTDWGGNATRVNNDINNGAFLLQHRDHGGTDGWGEPNYGNGNINGLHNTDLTWIFSINCLTGKFNISGECFAEKFHRYTYNDENSGALGITAATEVSYSFVNDTYVWGMYDNMWPQFLPDYGTNPESRGILPAFGNAAGKYFLQQSSWPSNPGNKEVTYYLFHSHGGAFSTLYSEVPQNLTVVHEPVMLGGLDYFTVSADQGAFISLTVDDQIIGTAEATGEPLDVSIIPQLPGTFVDIVITKQNYYRYENRIQVIPPEGPYCIYNSHSITDSLGNNNGIPDFNEKLFVDMTIKNLGNEDGQNVVVDLQSDDVYISFVDSTETYETVLSDSTATKKRAFIIQVSDSIPDQHTIQFDVVASDDNDSVWNSKFIMTFNAPVLVASAFAIDDSGSGNGDGILDPGETADMLITVKNMGHSTAFDIQSLLESANPFVTVNISNFVFDSLEAGTEKQAVFNITVDNGAPVGFVAEMICNVSSAGYSVTRNYYPKIHSMIEDFETGDFSKYDWETAGTQPWTISGQNTYEGNYCAKSGNIGDSKNSMLYISYEVMADDTIRFYRNVSSEQDYDFLYFYMDNHIIDKWSGTDEGWVLEKFPVTAGQHTFMWMYRKDYSSSSGNDCAMIDYIELPTKLMTTMSAGVNAEICYNQQFQCDAIATYYDSLYWTTSGDGIFSDNHELNPQYTPGPQDIETGMTYLKLNVFGSDGDFYDDSIKLTVKSFPQKPSVPIGPDTVDVFTVSETTFSVNNVETAESYNWKIYPAEAGEINGNDTAALVVWNPDYMDYAWIKVKAANNCGESEFSDSLQVYVDNTSDIADYFTDTKLMVVPNPNNGNFILKATLENGNNSVSLRIYNMKGNKVFAKENILSGENFVYRFSGFNVPEGMYFVVLNSNNGNIMVKKILINR